MLIIGISISHDGTLTVLRNGERVFSIGEERINRTKAYIGFPFRGLRYVVENGIVCPEDVDLVVIPTNEFVAGGKWIMAFELTEDKLYYDFQNDERPAEFYINDTAWQGIETDDEYRAYVERKVGGLLADVGIECPVKYVNHHLAHAASAYYSSGRSEALAITLDAEGDRLSGSVNVCRGGRIEPVRGEPVSSSLGYLYSTVTKRCGFKMTRHEGKITGLAAFGDHSRSEERFAKELVMEEGTFNYPRIPGSIPRRALRRFKRLCGGRSANQWEEIIGRCGSGLSREDLSAAVQHLLEQRVREYVRFWVNKTGIHDVVLAGGVFANVKFNQEIGDLPEVDSLFIYPDMGDGGLAYGGAALAHYENNVFRPGAARLRHVYFGPAHSSKCVEDRLRSHADLTYHRSERVEKETAELIHAGEVVGWFQGKMEYGPRALGNRSILVSPTDSSINESLNKRLRRTEFMPFAPSCLYEHADDVFEIKKDALKYPAEFMTITFRIKSEWASRVPAVVHVDQTARPQLVRHDINPRYYRVLKEYQALSGLPLFINTSFNVHEQPIVCRPEEAISALLNGAIDYLVIDDFVCRAGSSPREL